MPPLKLCRLPSGVSHPKLVRRLPQNSLCRDRRGEVVDGCRVVGFAGMIEPSYGAWLCNCRCGSPFLATSSQLSTGRAGCGCRRTTHGLTGTLIYKTWRSIVGRCCDPGHSAYYLYGAKGVTVCARWRKSVTAFAEDIGLPPSDSHVLELIDRRRGYRPGNCRWVVERERRLRSKRWGILAHKGKRLMVKEWANRLGISRQALEQRLQLCESLGAPLSEAISTPVGQKMPCVRKWKEARRRNEGS